MAQKSAARPPSPRTPGGARPRSATSHRPRGTGAPATERTAEGDRIRVYVYLPAEVDAVLREHTELSITKHVELALRGYQALGSRPAPTDEEGPRQYVRLPVGLVSWLDETWGVEERARRINAAVRWYAKARLRTG